MAAKRVRIHLSYNQGGCSELEEALASAGADPANSRLMAKLLALGALAWSKGAVLADRPDGLTVLLPGDISARPSERAEPAGHAYEESHSTVAAAPRSKVSTGVKAPGGQVVPSKSATTGSARQPVTQQGLTRAASAPRMDPPGDSESAQRAAHGKTSDESRVQRAKLDQKTPMYPCHQGRLAPQSEPVHSKAHGRNVKSEVPRHAVRTADAGPTSTQIRDSTNSAAAPWQQGDQMGHGYSDGPHDPVTIDLDSLLPPLGM